MLVWDSSTVEVHCSALRAGLGTEPPHFLSCAHIARLEHCKGLALRVLRDRITPSREAPICDPFFHHYIVEKGRYVLVLGRIGDSIF